MLFSSITFLIYFLPLVMGILFCLPKACRPFFLFAASLLFYGWYEPSFLILILIEIFCAWACGLLMQKTGGLLRRIVFCISLLIPAGLLFWFKYFNFFAGSLSQLLHWNLNLPSILLPLGISFYTFQIISYLVDVYRRSVPVQISLIELGAYITMFPQLIAGPIVRYDQLYKQIENWKVEPEDLRVGAGRFVCGLAKKVLIADQLAALSASYMASSAPTVVFGWMNAIAITLYIYFDFSGYSDMAIGLGRLMGFRFPENFDYPLMAGSFSVFWRRWHMTLTGWMKDYIYIPLGGSRQGTAKTIRNLLIVWIFTGLWHGAAWNFVLWGLLFFVLLCLEKFVLPKKIQESVLYHIPALLVIVLSFLLFQDDTLGQFAYDVSLMIGGQNAPLWSAETAWVLRSNLIVLLMAFIGATPWPRKLYARFAKSEAGGFIAPALMGIVLVLCIAWIDSGSFSPFLYFRF